MPNNSTQCGGGVAVRGDHRFGSQWSRRWRSFAVGGLRRGGWERKREGQKGNGKREAIFGCVRTEKCFAPLPCVPSTNPAKSSPKTSIMLHNAVEESCGGWFAEGVVGERKREM